MKATPPYFVTDWHSRQQIGDGHGLLSEALEAAAALGHTDELSDDGLFFIPRAYVVNGKGDYCGCPVFVLQPTEQETTP